MVILMTFDMLYGGGVTVWVLHSLQDLCETIPVCLHCRAWEYVVVLLEFCDGLDEPLIVTDQVGNWPITRSLMQSIHVMQKL